MFDRSGWSIGATLIALVGFACGGDTDAEALIAAQLSEGCLINSDCADPFVCAFRRCHKQCETSRDCDLTLRCMLSSKPQHVCQLEDEVACKFNSECPGEQVCGGGECRDQCEGDRDCVKDQVCVTGTCADKEELVDGKLTGAGDKQAEGEPCLRNSDCEEKLSCIRGVCAEECVEHRDCPVGQFCVDSRCSPPGAGPTGGTLPAHCTDGETNEDETDTDCGGSCFPRPTAAGCTDPADCISGVCSSGTCQQPSCSDSTRNGSETGVDCGGPTCDPCPASQRCTQPSDCGTGICRNDVCQGEDCGDGIRNGDETDIDCGGADCQPCDHTAGCVINGDCASGLCIGFACASPTCQDGVTNGTETGIDCGGTTCNPCSPGKTCATGSDCSSAVCESLVCAVATCTDGVQNGDESDTDCGGSTCGPCADGAACSTDGDCASGTCAAGSCKQRFTLTVGVSGSGSGSVTSDPPGIDCGATCEAEFPEDTTVTLTATPGGTSTFDGFAGGSFGGVKTIAGVSPTLVVLGPDAR